MITTQQIETWLARHPSSQVVLDPALLSAYQLGLLIDTICDALNNEAIREHWIREMKQQQQTNRKP